MSTIKSPRRFLSDPSLWLLLVFNLIAAYYAIAEGWSLPVIMLIYWFQSVTIGFFNFIRIIQLKEFSTQDFTINGKQPDPTRATKMTTAFFFAAHYGFFHLVYFLFIISGTSAENNVSGMGDVSWKFILLTSLGFFLNHLFSYLYNKPRDTEKQNIGTLMFYPYARILPMHLTIIFGSMFGNAIVAFLGLKILADVIMHFLEHNLIRKGEDRYTR